MSRERVQCVKSKVMVGVRGCGVGHVVQSYRIFELGDFRATQVDLYGMNSTQVELNMGEVV